MIYLKKTTETQNIYIPRQSVLGSAYVETVKDYEDGYNEGIARGEQIQKSKLINLTVTENGIYEKEDGYKTITVDIPLDEAYDNGYAEGYEDGLDNCPECPSISLENGSFTASANGEYTITPSEGFDGLESLNLTVNVECEQYVFETKSVEYTENGTYTIEPSENVDGLSSVEVTVNVECEDCPELTSIDITENGTYEGAFNVVNVDIPNYDVIAMELTHNSVPSIYNASSLRDKEQNAVYDMYTIRDKTYFLSYGENGVYQIAENFLNNPTDMISVKLFTLSSIGSYAFSGWTSLQSIDISEEFTESSQPIGTNAFLNCTSLTEIICRTTTVPTLGTDVFNGTSSTGILKVVEGLDYSSWLEQLGDGWTVEYL